MKPSFLIFIILVGLALTGTAGCRNPYENVASDQEQQSQQEKLLQEATKQTGMPTIKNFRERKIVKDLLELRDQNGLTTWTYVFSAFNGKFILLGQSVGYGIPAATQYTNPEKIAGSHLQGGYVILPQADPNGLFSPAAADATWVMLLDPQTKKVVPAYIEEKISVFPYELPPQLTIGAETL